MDKTEYIAGTDIPVDSMAGEEILRSQDKMRQLLKLLKDRKTASDEPIYSNADMMSEIDRLSANKNLDDLPPENESEYDKWIKERANIITECIQRRENGNLLKPESAEKIPDSLMLEVLSGL